MMLKYAQKDQKTTYKNLQNLGLQSLDTVPQNMVLRVFRACSSESLELERKILKADKPSEALQSESQSEALTRTLLRIVV